MASNVKVVLNTSGVRELLRSNEMMTICEEQANHALNKLGPGYEVTTHIGRRRVNASIGTATYEAMRDNSQNNSILKALR